MDRKEASRTEKKQQAVFAGTLPVWGSETQAPPVSDLFGHHSGLNQTAESDNGPSMTSSGTFNRGEKTERGCRPMTRIIRIAAALSALATVFLVSGAGSKY